MPSKDGRSTENEIALAVLKYLFNTPGGSATIAEIVQHLRSSYPFTDADKDASSTRPNELIWEQQVRNIVSHRQTDGNFIHDGLLNYAPGNLEITDAGASYLQKNDG